MATAKIAPKVIIVEGLDRLGKSTLIANFQKAVAKDYPVQHSGRPPKFEHVNQFEVLEARENLANCTVILPDATDSNLLQSYSQRNAFTHLFQIAANECIIFDRLHLGEYVYSPLYRKIIPGRNYLSAAEEMYLGNRDDVLLVLLTEDFAKSKHFVSDGESFDDSRREEEQELFKSAFEMSCIKNKVIVNVTAENGEFRDPMEILEDAYAALTTIEI